MGDLRGWTRRQLTSSILVSVAAAAGLLMAVGAGCGNGRRETSAAAPIASSTAATTTATSAAEAAPTAATFDYAATASCLDQYSGNGAGRSVDGDVRTITIEVPADETDESTAGAYLGFYPNAAGARKGATTLTGFSKDEVMVTGNVVISGTAVTKRYARKELLSCLQPS